MKTQVLLIHLGTKSEVLDTAHFISEYTRKNSDHELHMLTFKQNKKVAHLIKGVKRVYVIDQEEINNILNNRLYSDGFALNNFYRNLKLVFSTEWHSVINLSNNEIAYNLTSAMNTNQIVGGYKKLDKMTHFSSLWSSLPNTLFNRLQLRPLKNLHTQLRSVGLSYHQHGGSKLITNEKNNDVALQNLNNIKAGEHTAESGKIIGITINTPKNATLNLQHLSDLLDHIFSTPNYIPLLIIESGNEAQKQVVNHLNKDFDNSLLSVESDEIALPSLLMHLDLVISDSHYYTTSCSLVETPSIRVSKDIKTVYAQHSHTLNDLIYLIGENFKSLELMEGVAHLLEHTEVNYDIFDRESVIFRVQRDLYGTYPQRFIGSRFDHAIITCAIQRYYLTSQSKNADNTVLMNSIFEQFNNEIPRWCHIQKDQLMKTTKKLLRSLRLLVSAKEDAKNGATFLTALDELLESYSPSFLTAVPLAIFEYNLQKITSENPKENLIIMEHLLYDLKNSLQKVMTTLSLLESKNQSIKRSSTREEHYGQA